MTESIVEVDIFVKGSKARLKAGRKAICGWVVDRRTPGFIYYDVRRQPIDTAT